MAQRTISGFRIRNNLWTTQRLGLQRTPHLCCLRAATMSSAASSILPSRPVIPHIQTGCAKCSAALEFPVPNPHPRPGTLLQIRCFSCNNVIQHAFYAAQVPASSYSSSLGGSSSSGAGQNNNGAQTPRKGRKIGTQERPLEVPDSAGLGSERLAEIPPDRLL
jgi:hypothetical protein